MSLRIIEEQKNPLFRRIEVVAELESDSTPSHADIGKMISEKTSAEENRIKIKKIHGKLGSKKFSITALVYASEKDKNEIERKIKPKKAKA